MPWLYRRRFVWWIGWRANGKQFLKSTGETEKAKAEEKLREYEFLERAKRDGKLTQDFISSLTGRALPSRTLKRSLGDWLEEAQGSTSEATADKYRGVAREFSAFIGATDKGPMLQDVSVDEVRGFIAQKRNSTSAANANIYRKILSVFFIRALKNGLIKANPVLPVKQFKESASEKTARRPFTLDELKLLHDKAPSPFWRYMVVGGFYTGLRMGDLIQLPRGHVDLAANLIRTIPSKTRDKTVQIPIALPLRKLFVEIFSWNPNGKPSDPLWPEQAARYLRCKAKVFSREFYEDILAPAGLVPARPTSHTKMKEGRSAKRHAPAVSFHCLRHTFITLLKASGGNQAVAKELAGHSSNLVSDMYTHLPIETLNAAIAMLPEVAA